MVSFFESLQGPNAPPSPPLGAGTPSCPPHEASGETIAQGLRAPAPGTVETDPSDDDRERERDPRRERDCEHVESNAENERVHSQVVVGLADPAVPRMGDPSNPSLAAPGRACGRFRDWSRTELRASGFRSGAQ